ncbi:SDR family oxidoreductase [Lentisalinibacter sediminis]|uniref:SDR family oxidoreductase n=1 Tax=Lentisalinibacter sediminis TaxID=2992237 RepID=UPI003867E5CC
MTAENSDRTILVTGASGFIAMHCILQLLQAGFRVRGTLRSPSRETALRGTFAKHVDADDRLSFFTANLMDDEGWSEAIAGCDAVLHVASPLPRTPPKHEDDLIVPAREGVLRVLRFSSELGVRRVVMTSSVAAVLYGHERDGSKVYDESSWSIPEKTAGAYEKSKTLAERAAWEFMESLPEDNALELVALNPGLVLGPILDEDYGTSGEAVRKLMRRDLPGCPPIGYAPVDVRDVADAHLRAMDVPEAAGQRFILAIDHAWFGEIADILDEHLRELGYRIPTRRLPGFVLRLAALFDKTTRLVVPEIGLRMDISNERAKQVLGWQPRSLPTMVKDMADSMIEFGVA